MMVGFGKEDFYNIGGYFCYFDFVTKADGMIDNEGNFYINRLEIVRRPVITPVMRCWVVCDLHVSCLQMTDVFVVLYLSIDVGRIIQEIKYAG